MFLEQVRQDLEAYVLQQKAIELEQVDAQINRSIRHILAACDEAARQRHNVRSKAS